MQDPVRSQEPVTLEERHDDVVHGEKSDKVVGEALEPPTPAATPATSTTGRNLVFSV